MRGRENTKGLRTCDGEGLKTPSAIMALLALIVPSGAALAQTSPEASVGGGLQEIVVTATRHEESLSRVPVSVSAFTQDSIDVKGIKDFQDVARFTPGVNIDNSGTNSISIRGISSSGGAGTTGIYIDDTPIQIRALGFNPDDTLPKTFDLERVEVLRGPQGTLFGAGSEGGTVRYILPQPSLTKFSAYSRSELAYTQGGEASYEAGVAAGGPVVDGKFGVRASVWYRHDGGWIDRADPFSGAIIDKHSNRDDTVAMRLAATWAVTDSVTVSPSILYQDRNRHDVGNYWEYVSDPGSHRFESRNPTRRPEPDTYYMPVLKIEADLGATKLISNTSYYDRRDKSGYDGTLYNLGFYQTFLPEGDSNYPFVDKTGLHLSTNVNGTGYNAQLYRAPATVSNQQQNFTQEVRLQSNSPTSKLTWTVGAFFSVDRQRSTEQIYDPGLDAFWNAYFGAGILDPNVGFGADLYQGNSYLLDIVGHDRQIAGFGEASYSFTDQWKLTVGARYAKTSFSFHSLQAGSQIFSDPIEAGGDQSEKPFTPKASISYQMDPNNLFFATYSKGYRVGGANSPINPAACPQDFPTFGFSANNPPPKTFKSDTVQSYEVGAKNNFNNRLRLATSVYYIKWNDIQQTVLLPICALTYIDNLGAAEVKGADLQAEIALGDAVTVEAAVGYTDARYTKTSFPSALAEANGISPVVSSGDAVVGQSGQPGAPWTVSLGAQYNFTVAEHESFVRADVEYESKAKWLPAGQDPTTAQYDPNNYTLAATSLLSMRAGTKFGSLSLQAFIDNLLDEHKVTNYAFTGAEDSRLVRNFTFRPRTFGLTATYRY